MKIFNDKNIIEIDKEDIQDAKLSSLDIADQTTRKRAFLNILGGRIAMKYLFSQKLDANNLYSLYTIHNILKNIDISDIYCNNIHADVRIVFKEDELFIPKSHEENEICPDIYLIFKLNNSVTNATFLGYIESKDINKNNQNKDYYFVELDELKNPETIKTFLNNFSPEEKEISQEEIAQAESLFLTVNDTEISKKSLKLLVHTLLHNYNLREKLVEFENFEFLSKKIATDETLGQDNLLGIVGSQELYQDEKEQTEQEEKAEIIEEVLSGLIDETEAKQTSTNNLESEDFLNELISEEEKEDIATEENDVDEDKEKDSKNNAGELLKDTGIALAGAAGVIAAGAIAANAAETVIGEVAKDATQGATEALVSGVADIAGNIGGAIVENIEKSSEEIINNNDNDFEIPEIEEIEESTEDAISDLDLDEIEDNILDNIEDITETVEETTEEIGDLEIENIDEVESIENIDETPLDIEEISVDDEIENLDIEEINDNEITDLDIEEMPIEDKKIDDLEIEEVETDEDVDFNLDEITEETVDDLDSFEVENIEEIENIEDITETIEETTEEINDLEIENIDEVENIENIDEIPLDIEEISVDNDEINDLDIQEITNEENEDVELSETSDIDDFESLFEETDSKDNELDIQEFEIDEADSQDSELDSQDSELDSQEVEIDEDETDNILDNEEISNNEIDNFNIEENEDVEIEETTDEVAEESPMGKEENNFETTEYNDGFDDSLSLGSLGSDDLSSGLMPLDALEPIGDFGGNNTEAQYEYRPSAPMLDIEEEVEENEESSDKSNLEDASDNAEDNTEQNNTLDLEEISNEESDLDISSIEEGINIAEENLLDNAGPNDSLDLEEISNDIENVANDISDEIGEISNVESDLDISNIEESNIEEDINLDDISIEEVHNEFDPDSPLADTEVEPVFEGLTGVEVGFNNNMPDYMKDIEGMSSNQTEIVNLDDLDEDIMANANSVIEENDVQSNFANIVESEQTANNDADWGDISDILNETENLNTLDLDDNSLMEQMTSGVDDNASTEGFNLDDMNSSDALISDIDNFLSNINSPEETKPQTASTTTTTTAYSSEDSQEVDEQEDSNLKILFKEGRTPEIPNLFPTVTNFVNKVKSDKKMMIAASLACVVATSLLVATIAPKNNNNVVQNNSAQEMIDNNQMANSDGQNDVLTEQDAQNLGMDTQYQNETVAQQANLADPTQMDAGQVMSNAFSSEPVNTNITKIAWEVSEDLAYNDAFRKYLQMAGKNLKINLQNELLLLNELAYSDGIIVNISLDQTGNLKSTTIQKSSGSKKIDKLVLQCVKDTMSYLKVPTDEIRKSGADATLIINF